MTTNKTNFISLFSHGWHAGDGSGEGNKASIGIEIAQSTNDNLAIKNASIENGARLAARLLKRFNFGVDRLRKHQDWSGKNCPHDILGRYGWTNFVFYYFEININSII